MSRWHSVYGILTDELLRARVELYAWCSVGAWLNFGPPNLQDSVPWVSFMSLYAIVTSAATKVQAIKAARLAAEASELAK